MRTFVLYTVSGVARCGCYIREWHDRRGSTDKTLLRAWTWWTLTWREEKGNCSLSLDTYMSKYGQCSQPLSWRPLDSRTRATTSTRFKLRFFTYSQMIDTQEEVKLLPAEQIIKPMTLKLASANATFSLKLVAEWRWLPHFPAKMTLVHAWAILVLVVVLVLESIALS